MDTLLDIIADPRTGRTVVLLAVLLPFASAGVLAFLGPFARRAALWLAILHLAVTGTALGLSLPVLSERSDLDARIRTDGSIRFRPQLVPGDAGGKESTSGRTAWNLLSFSPGANPNRVTANVQFYVGLDGLNVWLLALASFMLIPAILVSWEAVTSRPGAFYAWLFVLQGGAIGAFLSFDVILFYVFFELTLIPAFFLIGNWGTGSGRRDAAAKFFLYTLAGSLLTLVGLVGIVLTNPNPETGQITFSLPDLMTNVQRYLEVAHADALAGRPEKLAELHATQSWLFLALVAGFLIKVPVWPFHTWLPAAYGEAPLGVTVLLSALLAKLGTFGLVRLVLPLTSDAAIQYGLPVVGSLAAFGIVYAALCAYAQKDLKLLVAYSSVSHLGFLVLAVFAFNTEGLSGAVLHMVNHGLSTGGMFALLGFLFDRYRTTQMSAYGGLMGQYPNFAVLSFVLCLASIGLPGLNNFVSEMLMLAGLFDARNPGVRGLGPAVVAALGILLSAWYVLTMLQKVFFNPAKAPPPHNPETVPADVTSREGQALGSLAGLCLLLGLFPQALLGPIRGDVNNLARIGELARDRVNGVPHAPEQLPPSTRPSLVPPGGGPGAGPPPAPGLGPAPGPRVGPPGAVPGGPPRPKG